ncbi:MAG: cytochrome [Gemmatimonadales bacterium]
MRRQVLAVVGPGDGATLEEIAAAERVAELAARAGWVVCCGGRDCGVMAAAARGAARGGGISIGLLPSSDPGGAAPELTAALPTGLGEARNAVLAQSCDAMVACGMNPGTAAEVSLAIRAGKPVVLVRPDRAAREFLQGLGPDQVRIAASADEAISLLTTSS